MPSTLWRRMETSKMTENSPIPTIIQTPTGQVPSNQAQLPASGRRFRDAWRADGIVIAVDLPTAKGLAADEIRRARTQPLLWLDTAYMKASWGGGTPLRR